jgi:molybdate transport system ATP-binding protein
MTQTPVALQVTLRQRAPIPLAVELSCAAGELVVLVGPSGSGKTTILRTIAGLVHPHEGRIEVGGSVWLDTATGVRLSPQARRAGLVFQSYALFPHLTALENVAIAIEASGAAAGDANARARDLLARVKLSGLEARRPAALSGGQQQRVALARALARDPAVLLLDEPFSAVDQATRQTLYRELAELRRGLSVPIVLVTHDLFEARMLADRMIILDHGETLQQGTSAHILSRPRNARVAKLLGIQNHFEGVFHAAPAGQPMGTLRWGIDGAGAALRTLDKGRVQQGARVTWVIAGEHLSLRSAGPADDNTIEGTLEDALALGEITQCKIRVTAPPRDLVIVNVPTHDVRAMGLHVGAATHVRFDPAGIHIMPMRSASRQRRGGSSSAPATPEA